MIFKEIETDQEWSAATELRNLFNWSHPVSVEDTRAQAERYQSTRLDVRKVGLIDGNIAVSIVVTKTQNSPNNDFWYMVYVDPSLDGAKDAFRLGVLESLKIGAENNANNCMIEGRGEYPWVREILEEIGATKDMVLPFSCLVTADCEYSLQENVVSIADFLEQNPEDGWHRIWRCEMEVASDLPLPFPFVETPFETFKANASGAEVDLHSKFLFVEEGEIKGLSQLWPSTINRKLAATGLTGVRRDYRRQGVAAKLKQHAAAWAKQRGIEKIFTDNEENNPMYLLNQQLGFRRIFDYEVYSKTC